MDEVVITANRELTGSFDANAVASGVPAHYTVKGMFFTRLIDALGSEIAAVRAQLVAPARGDRYLPFRDYPQVDYLRLSIAAARKSFPQLSPREAVRRLARDDLATFSNSMLGRIVLAMAGDARSTLLRVPDAYARVTTGGPVHALELDADTVRVEFQKFYGLRDYQLGQLEGVTLHFGTTSGITRRDIGPDHVIFDVRHR